MRTRHAKLLSAAWLLASLAGASPAASRETAPAFAAEPRDVRQARVGDYVEYAFHSQRTWRRQKDRQEIEAALRLTVLEADSRSFKLGIRIRRELTGSGDDRLRPLLARGLSIPFEIAAGPPDDRRRSPHSVPGDGPPREEELIAAGFKWRCSRYTRDTRPRDGPLTETWIAAPVGPLYLTGGLLKRSVTLSGFGARGGSTLVLTGLGTDSRVGAEKRAMVPYARPGAWFVEQSAEGDEQKVIRLLRKTEIEALAWPGAAPLVRARTSEFWPDAKGKAQGASKGALVHGGMVYRIGSDVELDDRFLDGDFLPGLVTARAGPYLAERWTRDEATVRHRLRPMKRLGGVKAAAILAVYRTESSHVICEGDEQKTRQETELQHHLADLDSEAIAGCPFPLRLRPWYRQQTIRIDGSSSKVRQTRVLAFGAR
ncbi:MAG: hypothetical protein JXR96_06390 [Deltaproteobacteria bacterium]|nr:hypothetical protein [Deltaproteobacteria bacterium]